MSGQRVYRMLVCATLDLMSKPTTYHTVWPQDAIPLLEQTVFEGTRLSPEACSKLEEAFPAHSLSGLPPLDLARLMLCISASRGSMSEVGVMDELAGNGTVKVL